MTTPKGITLNLEVVDLVMASDFVSCAIVKDAGDDPDVTHGIKVYAKVEKTESGFTIAGGEGVGRSDSSRDWNSRWVRQQSTVCRVR